MRLPVTVRTERHAGPHAIADFDAEDVMDIEKAGIIARLRATLPLAATIGALTHRRADFRVTRISRPDGRHPRAGVAPEILIWIGKVGQRISVALGALYAWESQNIDDARPFSDHVRDRRRRRVAIVLEPQGWARTVGSMVLGQRAGQASRQKVFADRPLPGPDRWNVRAGKQTGEDKAHFAILDQ